MGGQGESIKHSGYTLGIAGIMVPPGKGGGCVKTGPFAKEVAPGAKTLQSTDKTLACQ
jgi:tyrosinase